jgi:hypothetical protein
MFVRSDIYHKLGGFDDDFFAHMEEIDFCWRVKNEGFKVMYCAQSTVFHVGGGTLPKNNWRKTFLNFRNNLFLIYKNIPTNKILQVFFLRLLLDGIAGLKFLIIDKSFKDFFAVIKAHFYFYINIPKTRQKRHMFKHINVTKIYNGSIVYSYFIKHNKTFNNLNKNKFIR